MDSLHAERQAFVCIDVETSGPNPAQYSLLSLGAATVTEPRKSIYLEFRPLSTAATAEALSVHRLSLDRLAREGLPPEEALRALEGWLAEAVPPGLQPVFVAFNAPFDWMFVNDYFHRFLGRNPFGHKALDIKAYFMGLTGGSWAETFHDNVSAQFLGHRPLTHNALQDALDEAEMFANMLAARTDGSTPNLRSQSQPEGAPDE